MEPENILHMELVPGKEEKTVFTLKGDPWVVSKMLYIVMRSDDNIAAAILAGVVEYCKDKGIDFVKQMAEL